jgi:hypothetical protein
MTLSSAPGLTPPCEPPTLLVEFHHAPPAAAPAMEAELSKLDTGGASSSASPSALSSGPAAAGLASPGARTEDGSLGPSRAQKRSCGHLIRRRACDREGGASARICSSHAFDRALREGRFAGPVLTARACCAVLARWWPWWWTVMG